MITLNGEANIVTKSWIERGKDVWPTCSESHPCLHQNGFDFPCEFHQELGLGLHSAFRDGCREAKLDAAQLVEDKYHDLVAQKVKVKVFMFEFFKLGAAIRGFERGAK